MSCSSVYGRLRLTDLAALDGVRIAVTDSRAAGVLRVDLLHGGVRAPQALRPVHLSSTVWYCQWAALDSDPPYAPGNMCTALRIKVCGAANEATIEHDADSAALVAVEDVTP